VLLQRGDDWPAGKPHGPGLRLRISPAPPIPDVARPAQPFWVEHRGDRFRLYRKWEDSDVSHSWSPWVHLAVEPAEGRSVVRVWFVTDRSTILLEGLTAIVLLLTGSLLAIMFVTDHDSYEPGSEPVAWLILLLFAALSFFVVRTGRRLALEDRAATMRHLRAWYRPFLQD
jgi:hypothetical protein